MVTNQKTIKGQVTLETLISILTLVLVIAIISLSLNELIANTEHRIEHNKHKIINEENALWLSTYCHNNDGHVTSDRTFINTSIGINNIITQSKHFTITSPIICRKNINWGQGINGNPI